MAQRPLFVNGYGVELTLKRTDYIVIDDREAATSEEGKDASVPDLETAQDAPADLRPLSTSEVANLGINAASFIMNSAEPFETLQKLSQDFPKHSSAIAAHNASDEFMQEYRANREAFLPAGYNIMWINGIQVDSRQFDAFSFLTQLRRERALIDSLRSLGLKAKEAIQLLSHNDIAQSQANSEVQRYDYRDSTEGGEIIIWLNDVEKDKRYEGWPTSIQALLQRTYPGQLPTVRRDIHNIVLPVDLADPTDLEIVSDTLQNFVKRKVPARFGIVPTLRTSESALQARIAYHLQDTYGLGGFFRYLETLTSKKVHIASKSIFTAATADRGLRRDREAQSYEDVLSSQELESRLHRTNDYLERLAANGKNPPFFANGVAIPKDDSWLESMSARVTTDLRAIQRGVFEEVFQEDTWLANYFLFQAALRRNALVIPDDESSVKVLDLLELSAARRDIIQDLPKVPADGKEDHAHLTVIADLDLDEGAQLLRHAVEFRKSHPAVELMILHNPKVPHDSSGLSSRLYDLRSNTLSLEVLEASMQDNGGSASGPKEAQSGLAADFWHNSQALAKDFGLTPGQSGLVLNGRLVGPMPRDAAFTSEDVTHLLQYEQMKRLQPVARALKDLKLEHKVADSFTYAKLTALVARSLISDLPEGIYDAGSLIRTDRFNAWEGSYTSISRSTCEDPSIRIVAAIDPAAEMVQRYIPILKVLSELHGVSMKIFLNPREKMQELPVKRFYRHVLEAAPVFNSDGALQNPQATFTGIPADALLNLGMDLPPSWLVAPKDCVHDLDNIKLSSLAPSTNINAIYELEHILIEGHSRDMTAGSPPRGVQLLLGSETEPHFADTSIMANLGYFQFKANPGYYHITLMSGRSSKIYNMDSIGSNGWAPVEGDDTTEVALMSFQGLTLYPRLSRKPGMEKEDVLEDGPKAGSALSYLSKGASLAGSALSSIGLRSKSGHADINIFSVASGHLYERMLNIMILSVMKHTSHTVKFWFIEQFLSPSFKTSLPHLAREYKFEYEMVTYKWPHWLRAQKEKQREIWGYKILFLDVLFPMSLDKVIFVDADQIVRTDMYNLIQEDLEGAPYGFTPMCDSRTEMEGFRFWKQGYWKNFLRGLPYHISALYVVDLKKFREIAAGDRLRQQYHSLSADPASLSNLDQDLPNHMQHMLPIKSLPQEWLWCETWCSDETLSKARTIDLCNNPLTKEPKLDRARRQVPEWTEYDEEIAAVLDRVGREEEDRSKEEQDEEIEMSPPEDVEKWEDVHRQRDEL